MRRSLSWHWYHCLDFGSYALMMSLQFVVDAKKISKQVGQTPEGPKFVYNSWVDFVLRRMWRHRAESLCVDSQWILQDSMMAEFLSWHWYDCPGFGSYVVWSQKFIIKAEERGGSGLMKGQRRHHDKSSLPF